MDKLPIASRLSLAWAALRNRLTGVEKSGIADVLSFGVVPTYGSAYLRRGTQATLSAFDESPWLRSVEGRIMSAISTIEWQIYGVQRGGKYVRDKSIQMAGGEVARTLLRRRIKAGEAKKVERHPMYDVIYQMPGRGITVSTVAMIQMYLDLVGESFALKERDADGKLTALWPIPPSWVKSVPTDVAPYFEIHTNKETGQIPYEEIVWIRHPSPNDPYLRGSGIAMTLGDEIDTDDAASKYVKGWFLQGAMPPVIVSAAGPPGNADTQRLERTWIQKTQGLLKRHVPFFLNRAVNVHQLSHTFQEMEVNSLRRFERDVMVQTFGVPPEVLGVIENSNRSTIDAADYLFTTKTIIPRLEMLRAAFQAILQEEYDDRIIITYESPVFEDKEFILKVARSMPASRTIDEWRSWQGLDAMPDGKGDAVVMISGYAWVPSSALGGEIVYTTPNLKDGETVEKFEDEDDDDESFEPEQVNKAPPSQVDRLPQEGVLAMLEERYTKEVAAVVLAALLLARDRLDTARIARLLETGDIDSIMEEVSVALGDISVPEMMGKIRNAMAEAGATYARMLEEVFGVFVPFDVDSSEIATWIFDHEELLLDELRTATQNGVQKVIDDGASEGKDHSSIALLIGLMLGLTVAEIGTLNEAVAEWEAAGLSQSEIDAKTSTMAGELIKKRAERIAGNEVIIGNGWAWEFANRNAAASGALPVTEYQREWVVTWDDRLCPLCAAMAGELSPVGGYWATANGPVAIPNEIHPYCRCTYVMVTGGSE